MESTADPRLTVDLYKCPGSGRVKERVPQYSFPKNKGRSYLEALQKWAKRVPSPVEHHSNLKWIKNNSNGHNKGSDRITIIDKIFKEKKDSPSPYTYDIAK